jgi:hypothetical protein
MVDDMTTSEARALARRATAAWETGAAYASITTTPWATIAADLDAAADALDGHALPGIVTKLRARAVDARHRAQCQARVRSATEVSL